MMPTHPFPVVPKVIPASLGALWLLVDGGVRPRAGQLVWGVWRGQEEGAVGVVSTRHVLQLLGPGALFWEGGRPGPLPDPFFL